MPEWAPAVARQMLGGLELTLVISLTTAIAATAIGVVLGSLACLRSPAITLPIGAYVELWRGLPVILTLFFVFFMLPAVGVRLDAVYAALIGLTLWASANSTEIVRGAVRSIPAGQAQAASALGLGWVQAMRCVILPQAQRRMLPPLVSLMSNLVQTSALAAAIGVAELTQTAERQRERLTLLGDSHSLEIFGTVMVLYFVICLPMTRASARLERRLQGW
jgi:His/Glu/Gln/Arg/opine family amino acid ABC transporter permease subunit